MDASVPRFSAAVVDEAADRVWVLRPHCALAPGELAVGCLLPCVFALAAALAFTLAGYPLVAVFVSAEMLAVGVAFVACARHAGDRETLTLRPRVLEVEQRCGGQVQRTRFDSAWVQVRHGSEVPALIHLSAAGHEVAVGRHLGPEARLSVECELRAALRAARP
jgi:uncharacterized membrane protein